LLTVVDCLLSPINKTRDEETEKIGEKDSVEYVWAYKMYSVWLRTGRLGDRGSIPGGGKEDFSSSVCPDRL